MADGANPETGTGTLFDPTVKAAPAADPAVAVAPAAITLDGLKSDGIPETYFKDGNLDAKALAAALTEGQTLKAQAEERAKAIPADGKYSFDLPKEFEVPKGYEWKPDADFTTQVAALAKEEGLTQGQLSKLTVAYAKQDLAKKAADAQAIADASTAEMGKLGATAKDRLAAVQNFATANLGNDLSAALTRELTTAASVEAVEKLINLAGAKLATKPSTNSDKPPTEFKPGMGARLIAEANSQAKN